MAIIIETCPKCGHDLQNLVICTYPPIPRKECHNCGWSWEGEEGEREEIIRVPFGGNKLEVTEDDCYKDFLRIGFSEEESKTLANLAVNSAISHDGILDIEEAKNSIVSTLKCVNIENLKDLKQGF